MEESFFDDVAGCDDVSESRLKGSTADEETVDIDLRNELVGVLLSDGATVDDSGLLGNSRRDLSTEPAADKCVDFLCLSGRSNLAGADSPDRFVGDDNLCPVSLIELC